MIFYIINDVRITSKWCQNDVFGGSICDMPNYIKKLCKKWYNYLQPNRDWAPKFFNHFFFFICLKTQWPRRSLLFVKNYIIFSHNFFHQYLRNSACHKSIRQRRHFDVILKVVCDVIYDVKNHIANDVNFFYRVYW